MKYKNKHTGQVGDFIMNKDHFECVDLDYVPEYKNLSELNEEWTDYEEPKGNWVIDPINEDYIDDGKYTSPDELERYEELGLKFNTEEEAKKAVEKLKAWKRLKDKGIKVIGWYWVQFGKGDIEITLDNVKPNGEHLKDLDLLFGGEE